MKKKFIRSGTFPHSFVTVVDALIFVQSRLPETGITWNPVNKQKKSKLISFKQKTKKIYFILSFKHCGIPQWDALECVKQTKRKKFVFSIKYGMSKRLVLNET